MTTPIPAPSRPPERDARAKYVFRLYVTGATPQSSRAVANLTALCERHLKGRYEIGVIDIYQHRDLARRSRIVVAPTLVKQYPAPVRRVIGDLSNADQVRRDLGLDLPGDEPPWTQT
ncbi:MAG TPA: circadian clock KaiB family protein [Opitutaceae bacterium]|nr:circadian clock KaiB family protein [Opitutaceae bacterium]